MGKTEDHEKGLPAPEIRVQPAKNGSRRRLVVALLAGLSICGSLYLNAGYKPKHPKRGKPLFGRAAENLFLSVPNEDSAIAASRHFATKPHRAGSPQDLVTAVDFLHVLQDELGITRPDEEPIFKAGSPESRNSILSLSETKEPRAWIDTYYPILNTPLERHVQIINDDGKPAVELDLVERVADDTDGDAWKYADAVPTFHGLSRAGDVTGPLIHGGYCTKAEIDRFVEAGVNFNGSIVLCAYGYNFRGLKVKAVQEVGASGVLVYTDVNDDGTVTEKNGYAAYPHGPARNPNSVQRGSVQFISVYPGDPTTPGYPSYENATRTEGENIPSIPSLPLSWNNAQILLRTLEPGEELFGKKVRLVNNVDNKVTPIWNTLAVIPGHITNEVVVIGNHRDAWVLGATDPTSGTVSLHELVRGYGALLKKGWKPLRTILIATWDAEEYGLIGSTEWGEDFTEWIHEHVVAYLNLDSSASGSQLRFSGSPLLAHSVRRVAEDLPHPTEANRTLWDARLDDGKLFGENEHSVNSAAKEMDEMHSALADSVGVSPLGSGSDYTVFLQRIGVPSTDGGFKSTLHDPVYHYHSVFDTERWQELYGDPGFHRHIAVSKHLGLHALRISGAVVLPFNTTHYTLELHRYLDQVQDLAKEASLDVSFSDLRESIQTLHNASLALDKEKIKAEKKLKKIIEKWRKKREKGSALERARYRARELRRKLHVRRQRAKRRAREICAKVACYVQSILGQEVNCSLQKVELTSMIVPDSEDYEAHMLAVHAGFEGCYGAWSLADATGDGKHRRKFPLKKIKKAVKRIQAVNKKLIAFERGFISKDGIKDREWFKHLAVAPGKWLGYGATTLPGLTEAIVYERNATLVKYESDRLIELLDRLSNALTH
ncbi:hypothetical protein NMY22_g5696 [Coprinellus aureogranulatus]|nr:hypothetical protein NMY22_g5696 [Coprinellus aureogranulatus]